MSGPRERILIVEDAEDLAAAMAELLSGEGYRVTCAAGGRDALDLLERAAELPHLIMLDVMMPDIDGMEFRRRQRATPRLADIPILVMSAGGDLEDKMSALGASGYLRKPFKDIPSILEAVARCLPARDRT